MDFLTSFNNVMNRGSCSLESKDMSGNDDTFFSEMASSEV